MRDSALDFTEIDRILHQYGAKTVEAKIANHLKNNPSGRKLLNRGDFISAYGFEQVKAKAPAILKLYNSKKGTGGPKAAFGDVQYLNDIINSSKFVAAAAYDVGGVRIQSFSDYVPRMVFDYVQMVSELAAKKLPAHAYTKEELFVKQFGLTGIKINMSLIPKVVPGAPAGLDADGNYAFADESFDYDTALEIQRDPEYGRNCGTIAVGVSDEHIRKMLADPNIRMIIPYHKSGINPIVATMNNIAAFKNYTDFQNTRQGNGKTLTKAQAKTAFNFNERMHELGENADPRQVCGEYLAWCEKKGYIPKFEMFADDPNYYKLIEDFTLFDESGNYHAQGAVRMNFPTGSSAFGSMAQLIERGLDEDNTLDAKRKTEVGKIVDEIEATLPKRDDVKLSVRDDVYEEYDQWVKNGRKLNEYVVVGDTPDVLVNLGATKKETRITGYAIEHMRNHDGISDAVIKKVPYALENPILVLEPDMKDKNVVNSRSQSVAIYTDILNDNGDPVLVVFTFRYYSDAGYVIDDAQFITNAYYKNKKIQKAIWEKMCYTSMKIKK